MQLLGSSGKAKLVSQAWSRAGFCLLLPTPGRSALEHREDVKCMKMLCSSPAVRLAGTRGADGSC